MQDPYVLPSGGISRKSEAFYIDCEIQSEKGMHFFCFVLFLESFNNFGTTGPIQMGFSAKCTSPNEHFTFSQIENWKCYMWDFRLIPLDRITHSICQKITQNFQCGDHWKPTAMPAGSMMQTSCAVLYCTCANGWSCVHRVLCLKML